MLLRKVKKIWLKTKEGEKERNKSWKPIQQRSNIKINRNTEQGSGTPQNK